MILHGYLWLAESDKGDKIRKVTLGEKDGISKNIKDDEHKEVIHVI